LALTRWVRLSETLGYHLLMTSDHIATTPDVQARCPAPFYEPLSTLGWLAGITHCADDQRVMGEGTLDQVRRDLEALHALGCMYVLLDTFYDDVEATRHHETAWRMLITMAEKVLDLPHETLR
jgi:hypothetical protein